jgi:hypothetical protein
MIIIDGQIHLWEKGTPSAHHRQQPYLAEQAIAAMDAAGVDRALIHPVLWIEAVRPDPPGAVDRGGAEIPRSLRDHGLVLSRRSPRARYRRALEGAAGRARPALLHQRPAPAILVHRRHARLAVAGGRPGRSAGVAGCGDVSADRRQDCRAPPRPKADRRSHGRAACQQGRGGLSLPAGICWPSPNTRTLRSRRPAKPAMPRTNTRSAACIRICNAALTRLAPSGCSGALTSPACTAHGGNA